MADLNSYIFLIIDDVTNVTDILEHQLHNLYPNNTVIKFSNILEAKNFFDNNSNNQIVIICDWLLPEEGGISFLRYIRFDKQLKNIPFIILTTSNEKVSIMEAITLGASSYMTKPWTKEELKEKLTFAFKKHNLK